MLEEKSKRMKAPYAVAVLRILLAPVLSYAIMMEFIWIPFIIFILAFVSDIMDGVLAKKLGTTSSSTLEAYMDPLADFLLIISTFFAFSFLQMYPIWLLVVFIIMFAFFIVSSNIEKPIYDPLGKYYGTYLFITIGITILFPNQFVFDFILFSILVYTLALFFYRIVFLLQNRNQNCD